MVWKYSVKMTKIAIFIEPFPHNNRIVFVLCIAMEKYLRITSRRYSIGSEPKELKFFSQTTEDQLCFSL